MFAPAAERKLWSERLGSVPVLKGCEAWIHAASLGESVAVGPLAHELRQLDREARMMLTATTRTGRARLRRWNCRCRWHRIDTPQAVRRFFARVRPAGCW